MNKMNKNSHSHRLQIQEHKAHYITPTSPQLRYIEVQWFVTSPVMIKQISIVRHDTYSCICLVTFVPLDNSFFITQEKRQSIFYPFFSLFPNGIGKQILYKKTQRGKKDKVKMSTAKANINGV